MMEISTVIIVGLVMFFGGRRLWPLRFRFSFHPVLLMITFSSGEARVRSI